MECQQLQKQSLLHRIEAMPGPHRRRGQTQIVGLELPFLPFAATAVWEPAHLLIPDVAAHRRAANVWNASSSTFALLSIFPRLLTLVGSESNLANE